MQTGDVVAVRAGRAGYQLLELTGPDRSGFSTAYLGTVGDREAAMQAIAGIAELQWVDGWIADRAIGDAELVAPHRPRRQS
jgi:hypothetical protein